MASLDMLAGIAGLICSLVLVTNGSRFQAISVDNRFKLGLVWVVIIGAVALIAQGFGFQTHR